MIVVTHGPGRQFTWIPTMRQFRASVLRESAARKFTSGPDMARNLLLGEPASTAGFRPPHRAVGALAHDILLSPGRPILTPSITGITHRIRTWTRLDGAPAFMASNALLPAVAVLLGPLILAKVGLELYATLALAAYGLMLIASYSDFNTTTHLLAVFSRKDADRFMVLGNALGVRITIWLGFVVGLVGMEILHPRADELYALIWISLPTVLMPTTIFEWYFILKREYARLLLIRVTAALTHVFLITTWYVSDAGSVFWVPVSAVAAAGFASVVLMLLVGRGPVRKGVLSLKEFRLGRAARLFWRILPMASVLLLGPYFLAYALPWFSLVSSDKEKVGAFSISYRIVIGYQGLIVPMVFYGISKLGATGGAGPGLMKTALGSLVATAVCWVGGVAILLYYFRAGKVDIAHFPFSFTTLTFLLAGIFFLALRTPYVARCLHEHRYREYFLIHAVSCAPVLFLTWAGIGRAHIEWIALLACLPELLATTLFIVRYAGRGGPSVVARHIR